MCAVRSAPVGTVQLDAVEALRFGLAFVGAATVGAGVVGAADAAGGSVGAWMTCTVGVGLMAASTLSRHSISLRVLLTE